MRSKEVESQHINMRLDRWLVQTGIAGGRRIAQSMIRDGQVRVNGRVVSKATALQLGDSVSIEGEIPTSEFVPVGNSALGLDVLFEDEWMVVVNKPAGMPCHPLSSSEDNTMVNALLARYPGMSHVGYSPRESGLVHRLDNDTSGILLAAKAAETFGLLTDLLQQSAITKHYLALCQGHVQAPADIALPLCPDPKNRRRMSINRDDHDLTFLRHSRILTSQPCGDFSLVELSVSRAMRHQIRCHLAALTHPILGDTLYGGYRIPGFSRHFLHANYVSFSHPHTGKSLSVHAALPEECTLLLQSLSTNSMSTQPV